MSNNAEPLLDYLRGAGPAPEEFETTDITS